MTDATGAAVDYSLPLSLSVTVVLLVCFGQCSVVLAVVSDKRNNLQKKIQIVQIRNLKMKTTICVWWCTVPTSVQMKVKFQ